MRRKYMKLAAAALLVFLGSAAFFCRMDPSAAISTAWIDEKELGEMCVRQIVPAVKKIEQQNQGKQNVADASEVKNADEPEKEDNTSGSDKEIKVSEITDEPLVIIYHTHASESYMPYKESNYHREAEKGTVRDVGNVIEKELKKEGINVIHDKTVHDRPSYNESYSKSLATVQKLRKQYPSAVYIIDLHRDAATASAKEGKYVDIKGKRTAKFSMVVGQANENYVELYDFAEKIRDKAENMYEGFGGAIIERNYNYNEYLSNKCVLLEVGNNKNTIEEARLCGKYFAKVLAEIIKEEQ
ncbi:MAG: stage II sporulation protein P [Bacillota bacterium]|nr:stage II sporulation protein P [Bacillota bacterium]